MQCRKPSGRFGRFVGRAMNLGHTKVRQWGLSHIAIKPDSCVLDIGCGGGKAVNEIASSVSKGKVYGIDYSEDMVQLSKKLNDNLIKQSVVEIMVGTVSSLPFPDNMFDFVTAFETYYFWPDLINDLIEVKRVLKPGAFLLLVNAVYKDDQFEKRNSKLVNLLDIKIHTPDEYKDFLSEAGYQIEKINSLPEKNWITAVAQKSES
ncbi:MAG: methyltransferase domain-containing protein [Deltaproteobacteria bacterium]|jgi:ubiquinone/menaquinone biosynthesis C-methylase UbiE|nr:methyltransferase domain-containing protein [Deltaproteobacteria bacterium]MBW2469424.1 methyltransferase domain-containing protein [Deltaproteobacteria bacterium]MBW2517734.1 methyltransferase domain-containing protein [Deltaproteobacteria bacterium]